LEDCSNNFKGAEQGALKQECMKTCGGKFENSIRFLYDNFYEMSVGKESEYKSAKKL
jgi:hypothetical protein